VTRTQPASIVQIEISGFERGCDYDLVKRGSGRDSIQGVSRCGWEAGSSFGSLEGGSQVYEEDQIVTR
jgi:hypothetical protein